MESALSKALAFFCVTRLFESAFVVVVFPVPLKAAEAGVLVELLDFTVPVVIGDEFDLASFVFILPLGGGDDGEELPIGVMDGVFQAAAEVGASGVGVGGFDEVVWQSKKEGAVA